MAAVFAVVGVIVAETVGCVVRVGALIPVVVATIIFKTMI